MNTKKKFAVGRRKKRTGDVSWPPANPEVSPEVFAALEKWQPAPLNTGSGSVVFSGAEVEFAKGVAWASGCVSGRNATVTARAVVVHVNRLVGRGVPLTVVDCLSYLNVEETVSLWIEEEKKSGSRLSHSVTALRVAASTVNPLGGWFAPVSGREMRTVRRPALPYSLDEQMAFVHAARNLPTARRRQETTAVACLMMGGGLTGSEVVKCHWEDVRRTPDGTVIVTINGSGREVPVRWMFAEDLWRVRPTDGGGKILAASAKNAVPDLFAYARSKGLEGFEPWRAVNSWRFFQLCRLPASVAMAATGMSASQMAKLIKLIPPVAVDALTVLADAKPDPSLGVN